MKRTTPKEPKPKRVWLPRERSMRMAGYNARRQAKVRRAVDLIKKAGGMLSDADLHFYGVLGAARRDVEEPSSLLVRVDGSWMTMDALQGVGA